MKTHSIFIILMVVVFGACKKADNSPSEPDYAQMIKFSTSPNPLSPYYFTATINGVPFSYSTNDPLYELMQYNVASVTSTGATGSTGGVTTRLLDLGIGGYGSSTVLPPPTFFYIETPQFDTSKNPDDFIKENMIAGKYLDISLKAGEQPSSELSAKKYKIFMYARFFDEVNKENTSKLFSTSEGETDDSSSLLVKEVVQDSSAYLITFQFSCKLYNAANGKYFGEVKDATMKYKYTFK